MAAQKVSLTGVKPTGAVHLGNYLGAIRPALKLAEQYRARYFIADYHALTSERDPRALEAQIYHVAASWLASGLDPERMLIYRQSQIPEVFELAWVFSCLLAAGQLERGHAYKDALAKGDAPNAGLLYYPMLMAADIVLYDADVVPVGKDQKQHLELTRDVAVRLNHLYGEGTVVVPEAQLADVAVIPGTDGQKMSKSRGNGIELFAPQKKLRKAIMKIQTDSTPEDAPKQAEGTTVYEIFRAVASESDAKAFRERLEAGGWGWGHAKQALYELIETEIAPKREHYEALMNDKRQIDAILDEGADKARQIALRTMRRVRSAIGISGNERRRAQTVAPG